MENLKYQDNLNKIADKVKHKFDSKVKHTHNSGSDNSDESDYDDQ
jgi:hypothetical protein